MFKRRVDENGERDCIIKRLYREFDVYLQIGGFLTLAVPVLVSCVTYVVRTESYASDIEDLKKFQTTTEKVLLPLVQEVHDIHEIVVPRNYRGQYNGH